MEFRKTPHLFTLSEMGNFPSSVFMLDLGGGVFYSKNIIKNMFKVNNFYGTKLNFDIIDSNTQVSIKNLSNKLAADIANSSLGRPIHLIGHSFSGFLAFEVACNLVSRGDTVGLVALLNTELPPCFDSHLPRSGLRRILNIARWARYTDNYARLGTGRPAQTAAGSNLVLHEAGFVRMELANYPAKQRPIVEMLYRAMVEYEPSSYPGRVSVFRANDRAMFDCTPHDLGWGRYASDVRVHMVPGDHLEMVRDRRATAEVARILQTLIDQTAFQDRDTHGPM